MLKCPAPDAVQHCREARMSNLGSPVCDFVFVPTNMVSVSVRLTAIRMCKYAHRPPVGASGNLEGHHVPHLVLQLQQTRSAFFLCFTFCVFLFYSS